MADTYTGKKITEITENTSGADTDLLVVGNRGTAAMRRFTLANLATYIRDKLASLTFSTLNTSSKTLPGAINELNNNQSGFRVVFLSGRVTLNDGSSSVTTATIDITGVLPSGYSVYAVQCFLGNYHLPYVKQDGTVGTWISGGNNLQIELRNRSAAWTNYAYYLTLICKKA